jgi:hypothetical protein
MDGSSVTLIFYKLGEAWYREPTLNLIAALAQGSRFTHVELALGEDPGSGGQISNVLRIFNDSQGVELCSRTGRNPNYQYLSIGCSKAQVSRMMQFARRQVGKPFSNMGMARSVIFPRTSDLNSFYCAELVAACLQAGGLMAPNSNPGQATPYSLYRTYSQVAAVAGNPFTLRTESIEFSMPRTVPRVFASGQKKQGYRVLPQAAHPADSRQLSFASLGGQRR